VALPGLAIRQTVHVRAGQPGISSSEAFALAVGLTPVAP